MYPAELYSHAGDHTEFYSPSYSMLADVKDLFPDSLEHFMKELILKNNKIENS